MNRVVMTVGALVVAGSLGVMAWPWASRHLDTRARTEYFQQGKAYAARVFEEVGTLPPELRESSGLAVSRTQPGVLWSHNDSGDGPTLYAIDQSGKLLATVPVANAVARDWEDIATGPCVGDASGAKPQCLYIADTGNNSRSREVLTIYVVVEPLLDPAKSPPPAVDARSFRYRYPGEPDDAEALAVMPNGDVVIVSKGRLGTIDFFGLDAASIARAVTSGEVLTAENQGKTGIKSEQRVGSWVTAAALSPDATTLAVRTYSEIFFYAIEITAQGRRWKDEKRPCFLGEVEPQGEGMDYLDEQTLLVTSESQPGQPGKIHRVQC